MKHEIWMRSKGGVVAPTPSSKECCMCGDYGLLHELFQCTICLFRSQHRYCSNLYPKAGSYKVCNWCLNKEGEKMETGTNSSSISSDTSNEDKEMKKKKKKNNTREGYGPSPSFVLNINKPIKKQRSGDETSMQKKTVPVSGVVPKQGFRGKVRRYRLLEEVCR